VTPYLVPARETQVEIVVVNSRFVATAAPAGTVQEARAFVARMKERYADASHNVSAYVVGHGSTVTAHATDDGEPSGTAGRPALAVLQGSGVGDIVVVVTRYFGGTKLGTGGLVRAYGDAVRELLRVLPRAMRVPTVTVAVRAPYPLYERVRLLVEAHDGEVVAEDFGVDVDVTARFAAARLDAYSAALRELSGGAMAPTVVARDENAIVPIGSLGVGAS
jgi:uncharacterized YigZ family protein